MVFEQIDYLIESVLGPSSTGGYGLVNTIVLSLIALLFFVKVAWPIFKKNNIVFDFKLALAVAPYLLFGTIIRAIQDSGKLPYSINPIEQGFYTHTPGLWIFIAVLIIPSIVLFKKLAKESFDYRIWVFLLGLIFFIIGSFFFLPLAVNFDAFAFTVFLIALTSAVSILAAKFLYQKFSENNLNQLAIIGQAIDGPSTIVSTVFYNCTEQHFVSRAILEGLPFAFVFLKIAVVVGIIYFLDKEIKNENFKNYSKFIVFSMGVMIGARNVFTLLAGNC